MKLNIEGLKHAEIWQKSGFSLPEYDLKEIYENTKKNPEWLHLGTGNIFRAFLANVQQDILNDKKTNTGIIAAEGFDYEIIDKIYKPFDNLGILVTLKADGNIEKSVLGSITEAYSLNPDSSDEWKRLTEIVTNPSLKMISFTITEKGYNLWKSNGEIFENVALDFSNPPENAKSYIGKVAALLYLRYKAGKYPIAMVSMDNCSHNGDKLFKAIEAYAKAWSDNNFVDAEFYSYIKNPSFVSFPWTMIDKITPRPDENVQKMLVNLGFEDAEIKITSKNTYVATFVNAEEPQYLVIEDSFPNGRPNLSGRGIIFTSREIVDKVEKMKVCTCLNPLHTALAIFGCLLGYNLISEEMKNPILKRMVEIIGYEEGLPVVTNPEIISPKEFIDEVINVRLPNPFMPDSPQRIATDTSQKLGIRFGETIKEYIHSENLSVDNLKIIPLVLAGWCRYLLAVDDNGNEMTLSPDPMLEIVRPYLAGVKLGEIRDFHNELENILSNEQIFGIDLYKCNLGEKVENYFKELVSGKGAVLKTLEKYIH